MRIKAKHVTLGILADGGTTLLRDGRQQAAGPSAAAAAGAAPAAAPPFRLVPAAAIGSGHSALPAVAIASKQAAQPAARKQAPPPAEQASPPLPLPVMIATQLPPPPPPRAPLQPQQQTVQPAAQPVEAPPPMSTSGRPMRKRKASAYAADMVSTDELASRAGRARPAPVPHMPAPAPPPMPRFLPTVVPQHAQQHLVLSPLTAAGQVAAAAAGLPAALQLVSLPTANGGMVTGLALPAAALLALPHLLRGISPIQLGAVLGAPVMPYKMVPPGGGEPHRVAGAAAGSAVQQQQQQQVPAVQVATPRDILHLAKQLEEQERRQALAAAAEARVAALRALPLSAFAPPARGGRGGGATGPVPAGRGPVRGRGVGRDPRRRPTPDVVQHRRPAHLGPGTWHPGFECFSGVTHVSVEHAAAAASPPAVVVGVPPRFGESMAQGQTPEYEFGEDPLQASVEFLRYEARTAGRPPQQYSPEVAATASLEQRGLIELLGRVHYARDGRRLASEALAAADEAAMEAEEAAAPPVPAQRPRAAAPQPQSQPQPAAAPAPAIGGIRKSTRARNAAGVFTSGLAALAAQAVAEQREVEAQAQAQQRVQQQAQQLQQPGGRSKRRRTPSPDDGTDVRLGPGFQAELPALRPRPAAPTAGEARWTAGLVCRGGEVPLLPRDAKQAAVVPPATAVERSVRVSGAHQALVESVGDEWAAAMGLLSMGADACGGLLTEQEEAAFEEGMQDMGRSFHTMQLEYVPGRSVFDLQNFYFNVWKLRATPRSKAWYERKEADEAARQSEQERLEAAAAAEQDAARQRQEQRQKRRMLREVVAWVRGAARTPAEVLNRPTVVQRVQRTVKLLGSLEAKAR